MDSSGDDTEELLDVVNSKAVVPPDDVDILEMKQGDRCRVSYNGQFYKADVVAVGKCIHTCNLVAEDVHWWMHAWV